MKLYNYPAAPFVAQYTTIHRTRRKTPALLWQPGYSTKKFGGSWRWTPPVEKLAVPYGLAIILVAGVPTLVNSAQWAADNKALLPCWWLESSRGHSHKLVKGYLHRPTETHGLTVKKTLADAHKKVRLQSLAGVSTSDILARGRQSRAVVPLVKISREAGNCAVGTRAFLDRLFDGLKRPRYTAKIGAIVRLAQRRGLADDRYFVNATKLALATA